MRADVRTGLLAMLVLAGASPVALLPATVQAQQVQAQQIAFSIEAQPLPLALTAFGRQSGYQVSFDPQRFGNLQSGAVAGTMTAEEALRRLLAGTAVTWRYTDARSITLDPPPQGAGAAVLPPVTVEGRRGSDVTGGTDGFVARRSTAATKTDAPIIETPQSISVVTQEQMEMRKPQSLGDALRYTPGVLKMQGFNRTDDSFVMRGFQVSEHSLYLDGMRTQPNIYSTMAEPYALERIDVLRGPASVLYGQSSPGGTINMTSKRPTLTPIHEVQVQGGNFDRKQIATDHGDVLDKNGVWSYRVVALARDSDTMVDHIEDNRTYFAPSLAWRPNERTTLTLQANYSQSDTMYNYGFPPEGTVTPTVAGYIPTNRFIGEPDYNKWNRTTWMTGYLFEHQFNDTFQFRQNLRYAQFKNDYADVAFGTFVAGSNQTRINRSAYERLDKSDMVSVDNQLQSDFTTGPVAHTVLTGIDVSRGNFDRKQRSATIGQFDLYNPVYGTTVTPAASLASSFETVSDQRGIYAQDSAKYDKWVLLLGGRKDWTEDENKNRINNTVGRVESDAFTWRSGLVYLFDSGLAPYASYAESFQPTSAQFNANGTPLKPTTGQQYEVGAKYQPPGMNSSITAAWFDIKRQNATVSIGGGNFAQYGEISSRGYELEAVASLTEGLSLTAGYTFTDAEVTRGAAAEIGRKTNNAPQHMASLWADYKIQGGALAGLRFGGGSRYVGASFNTTNSAKADSYTIYDAMVRYDFGNWGLALNAINLLDDEYVAGCTYGCFYGDRRTVIGSVTYRW